MVGNQNSVLDTYENIISINLEEFYDKVWEMVITNQSINWSELFLREKELIINSLMSGIRIQKKMPVKYEVDEKSVVIREEWNYELNKALGIYPKDYSKFSGQEAIFDCLIENNHPPYKASLARKFSGNTKCPYCYGQRVCLQNSFGYNFFELAKSWCCEKNGKINPFKITKGKNTKYYFKCPECGSTDWYVTPYHRVRRYACPKCMSGIFTSFPEQAIYYYFKKILPCKVENRYHVKIDKKNWEIDVYLPDCKVGIEYLGEYYHRSRDDHDREKHELLEKAGIQLLIVRESERINFGETSKQFVHKVRSKFGTPEYFQSLKECILKCFHYLCKLHPELNQYHSDFESIDIQNDSIEIQKLIFYPKENHIFVTHPHLKKHWDFERNGEIKPVYFTRGSSKVVYWKCLRCGISYRRPIKTMCNSNQIIGCEKCMRDYMSLLRKKTLLKQKRRNKVLRRNLAETHPKIREIWDFERNGNLKPEFFKANDKYKNGKVWVDWGNGPKYQYINIIVKRIENTEKREDELKKQEEQILQMLLDGSTKMRIKKKLRVSHPTIQNVYKKYIESGMYSLPEKVQFKYDSELEKKFIELRDKGASFDEIREKLNLSHKIIKLYKKKLIEEGKISRFKSVNPNLIQDLFNKGYDIKKVADELNLSERTIENYVYRYKLVIPKESRPQPHIFETNPYLKEIYDFQKNKENNIDFKNLTKSSENIVFWICKKHGSYTQRVVTKCRAENYKKCRKCVWEDRKKKYKPKKNSLFDLNPELISEIWIWDMNERHPKFYSANTPREKVWVIIDGKLVEKRIDHLNIYIKNREKKEHEDKELKKQIHKLLEEGKTVKEILKLLKIGQDRFYRLREM